jgi:S-adenosylmethionine/arginine decarboxylase-like enzyme
MSPVLGGSRGPMSCGVTVSQKKSVLYIVKIFRGRRIIVRVTARNFPSSGSSPISYFQ